MRTPSYLILTLVLSLATVRAHAQDGDECPNEKGRALLQEELQGKLQAHWEWLAERGWRDPAVSGRAILCNINLRGAQLEGADLRSAQLTGARLAFADVTEAEYAPIGVPNDYVEGIEGLGTVRVSPANASGLVQLRELLRKAGLRDQEREATYAIERNVTHHLLFAEEPSPEKAGPIELRWREPLALAEGIFRLVAFEGPVAYGLQPGRALLILLAAIGGFALVYAAALATSTGEIYRV